MPTRRLPPCFGALDALAEELELELELLPQAASKEARLTPAPATSAPLRTSRRVYWAFKISSGNGRSSASTAHSPYPA